MVELAADLFVVPTDAENVSIIYSPLRGAAFYASSEATDVVKEFLENGSLLEESKNTTIYSYLNRLAHIEVDEPSQRAIPSIASGAIFILSQICNLACSYCYAQNSRSREVLARDKVKATIDIACEDSTQKNKHFSFIGGGEPLATWEIFEWSVSYIRKQEVEKGIVCRIGLTTNGTLLNQDRVLFLRDNRVGVSVSSDILPEVQDEQRPFFNKNISSFQRVDDGIKLLLKNGVIPRIRSTVTNRNVHSMPQMVEFVLNNYPGIKVLHFEPVADVDENCEDFYKAYKDYFIKARQISKAHGIILKNSITHSFSRSRARFCSGEFCITPSSDIVSCHRISSDKEGNFGSFRYGKVTNEIEIDSKALAKAQKMSDTKTLQCQECFAKWHCAGGCMMYRTIASEEMLLSYCTFVRSTIAFLLDESLRA